LGPCHVYHVLPRHGDAIQRTGGSPVTMATAACFRFPAGPFSGNRDECGIFPLVSDSIQEEIGGIDWIERPSGDHAPDFGGGTAGEIVDHGALLATRTLPKMESTALALCRQPMARNKSIVHRDGGL
jgi:hypothetical protein